MQQDWSLLELAQHFTLSAPELALLGNKTGATRLGFAVLLKFFQYQARFPFTKSEISRSVIAYLAPQVKVPISQYLEYDWRGRAIKNHRRDIRLFEGFREVSVEDFKNITATLTAQTELSKVSEEVLSEAVYAHLRLLKIEPPTPARVERLVHSVMHTFEENFFTELAGRIPLNTKLELDRLLGLKPKNELTLATSNAILKELTPNPLIPVSIELTVVSQKTETPAPKEKEKEKADPYLAVLRTDPLGHTLESVLREGAKLQRLHQIVLPSDLFSEVTPRQLHKYRQRVATETLGELVRHPLPLRYTLLAAFCTLRQKEITDNLLELLTQIVHRIRVKAETKADKALLSDLAQYERRCNQGQSSKQMF